MPWALDVSLAAGQSNLFWRRPDLGRMRKSRTRHVWMHILCFISFFWFLKILFVIFRFFYTCECTCAPSGLNSTLPLWASTFPIAAHPVHPDPRGGGQGVHLSHVIIQFDLRTDYNASSAVSNRDRDRYKDRNGDGHGVKDRDGDKGRKPNRQPRPVRRACPATSLILSIFWLCV